MITKKADEYKRERKAPPVPQNLDQISTSVVKQENKQVEQPTLFEIDENNKIVSREKPTQQTDLKQNLISPQSTSIAEVKIMQQEIISIAGEIRDALSKLDIADSESPTEYEQLTQVNIKGSHVFENQLFSAHQSSGVQAKTKEPSLGANTVRKSLELATNLGAGGAKVADGLWGPRTNNSLNYLYSSLYAAASMLNDSQFNNELTTLHSNIPSEAELSAMGRDEKKQRAENIVSSFKKIKTLVGQFSNSLEKNKDFLSQRKPIYDHSMSVKQIQIDPSIANMEIGQGLKISDLQDLAKVKEYLKNNAKVDVNNPDKLIEALDGLKSHFAKQQNAVEDRK